MTIVHARNGDRRSKMPLDSPQNSLHSYLAWYQFVSVSHRNISSPMNASIEDEFCLFSFAAIDFLKFCYHHQTPSLLFVVSSRFVSEERNTCVRVCVCPLFLSFLLKSWPKELKITRLLVYAINNGHNVFSCRPLLHAIYILLDNCSPCSKLKNI